MRKISSPFLGLPVAALAVVGLSLGSQNPAPANLTGVVGVVNALQVFNTYPKAIEGRAELEKMAQEFNDQAKQIDASIQQYQLELMSLDASAVDERNMKTLQLDLAQRDLQGRIQVHEARFARQAAAFSVAMYEEIWEATNKVAVAKGLKLVLRMRELDPGSSPDNRRAFNDRRTVLYAAPELDLTQDVIKMLN